MTEGVWENGTSTPVGDSHPGTLSGRETRRNRITSPGAPRTPVTGHAHKRKGG
ncbi:hypothetical protein GCM10010478_43390 [Streptomyces erythrogriseus]|uniref:Uncharacterized protein n=1 Tax=Streptomyces erythrogriseus TaxID=284027 RepID=A0ABP6JQI4_9ACTN